MKRHSTARIIPRVLGVAALLVLTLGAGTCQKPDDVKTRVSDLQEASKQFGIALRWGYYDHAVSYLASREETAIQEVSAAGRNQGESAPKSTLEEPAKAPPRSISEDVHISSYKIKQILWNSDTTEATIRAEIEYYRTNTATVHKTSYQQLWWYEPESKRWFLEGDLPLL